MKKSYFDPEMKLIGFSTENVVTTGSGGLEVGGDGDQTGYSNASVKTSLNFSEFTFANVTF